MPLFDPLHTPIQSGLTLIEAGAGTGKTYSLVRVIARQLVEQGIPIENILIVTFTKAATAEIHTRLFSLLTVIQSELNHTETETTIDLVEKWQTSPELTLYLERLNLALASFDQANIFTIDGFFQRLQQDNAITINYPIGLELITNEKDLLQQALQNYWRKSTYLLDEDAYQQFTDQISYDEVQSFVELVDNNPSAKLDPLYDPHSPAQEKAHRAVEQLQKFLVSNKDYLSNFLENTPKGASVAIGKLWHKSSIESLQTILNNSESAPFSDSTKKYLNLLSPSRFLDPAVWKKNTENDRLQFQSSLHIDLFEQLETLLNSIPTGADKAAKLGEALKEVLKNFSQLKKTAQVQSYSDVTQRLYRALEPDTLSASILKSSIHYKYQSILIDEFQDTSPQQCSIFLELFHTKNSEAPYFFIIGDPKQSIYKFRGADVYSYITASKSADFHYSLLTNYRSTPELTASTNFLFSRVNDPFLTDGVIRFEPALSTEPIDYKKEPTIELKHVKKKDDLLISQDIAQSTLDLLEQGINASEIAVLVRTGRQALEIFSAYQQIGIPATLQTKSSLFQTPDAREFSLLLSSLSQPRDQKLLRAALLLPCLGRGAALKNVDAIGSSYINQWLELNHVWRTKGLLTMVRRLDENLGLRSNFLRFRSAERKITNFFHLAEITNEVSIKKKLSINSTVNWLAGAIDSQIHDLEAEVLELKISTDADAVQILTLHKSKGLEYDYVFLPYVNDGKSKKTSLVYHDNIGQPFISSHSENIAQRDKEELADIVRLFYVGVTRAKLKCFLYYYGGRTKGILDSTLSDESFCPETFAESSQGLIQYSSVEASNHSRYYHPDKPKKESLSVLHLEQLNIRQNRYTSSFSGLTRNADIVADYDSYYSENTTLLDSADQWEQPEIWNHFQAGSALGLVFHEILEVIDFQDKKIEQSAVELCLEKLTYHQPFRRGLIPSTKQLEQLSKQIAQSVSAWMHHDLGDGLKLKDIKFNERLNEARFLLKTEDFQLHKFSEVLATHTPPHLPTDYHKKIANLPASHLTGFLDGFIDLIFLHNGKYHILDWKTNSIDRNDLNYLAQKMGASHYYLQYHIYLLALDKILQTQLGNTYSPEDHLGNVYYLFLRGIDPSQPASGVYSDSISSDRMKQLRKLI